MTGSLSESERENMRGMMNESIAGYAPFEAAFGEAVNTALALQEGRPEGTAGRTATDREVALGDSRCAAHGRAYEALTAAVDAFAARRVADALAGYAGKG